jgi:hypothetical protein
VSHDPNQLPLFPEPAKRDSLDTLHVLAEVLEERHRQDEKWGVQNHPVFTDLSDIPLVDQAEREHLANWMKRHNHRAVKEGVIGWDTILAEEIAEAYAEVGDHGEPNNYRGELIQVAAVVVAMIENLDRDMEAKNV